jgi:hypothetical protein
MPRLLRLAPLLCLLAACGGPPETVEPEAAGWGADTQGEDTLGTSEAALQSTFDFVLRRGEHDSHPGGPRAVHFNTHVSRSLRFRLMFPAGSDYATANPANQSDFNKVMGITTDRIHQNSVRLGWAWNPATRLMDLGFYAYVAGTRTMQVLKSVPLGQWTDVEMTMNNDGVKVRADAAVVELKRSLGLSRIIPTTTWILCTAYFGGDETAPKNITVQVRDIAHD